MGFIITITGLLLGISIYFILINLFEESKNKIKKMQGKNSNNQKKALLKNNSMQNNKKNSKNNSTITDFPKTRALPNELKNQLPGRMCPLCSHILTRDEPLYATTIKTDGVKKILIYGCQYCHKNREPETIEEKNE